MSEGGWDAVFFSWGDALAEAAERWAYPRTLTRGLREWSRGAVSRLEVQEGMLFAAVEGAVGTGLLVEPLSAGKQRAVLNLLATDARWGEDCRAGDPEALLQLGEAAGSRGIQLGPDEGAEPVVACTCGPVGDLCWHAVALLQAVAERLDEDPQLWLAARGLPPALLAEAVPRFDVPDATVPEPEDPEPERLQDRVADFWTGTGEPEPWPPARARVPLDERSDGALREVFRPEFAVRGRNRVVVERHVEAAVSALREMYAHLTATPPPTTAGPSTPAGPGPTGRSTG